ncbi:MAG TPA: ABC transporter substrate-binding protein [Gaiellaceae bacterium]|nr:ABC transporter substrate-binding protein [Gaiellaceae bacterium]
MAKRVLWILAALALVATLAACGGDDDEAVETPTGTTDQSEEDGGEIVKGGLLRIGTTGEIDSINPFVAFNSESYQAFVIEYPLLVQYSPEFEWEGDWAESWETSEDGLTWTFTLKPGAWSDGQPLTAEDAVWTGETVLRFAKGPTSLLAPFLSHVKGLSAPDPQTLVIEYDRQVGNVLPQLQQFFILPRHVWEPLVGEDGKGLRQFNPQDALPVVGAGPFVITKFDRKGTTIFEKNPHYYGPEPNVDAVGYQHFENEDALLSAFGAGEIDFLEEVPPNAVGQLEADEDVIVSKVESTQINNFIFNSNPEKPDNRELLEPRVREAFEYAIDREEIAEVVFGGNATPVASIVAPITGEWMNPNIQPLPYDPDEGNRILDELGYARGSDGIRVADGEKMEYELILPTGVQGGQRTFEIIQKGLDEIGVKVTPKALDDTTAFEEIGAPDWEYLDFDLSMWSWVGYLDPDFVLSVTTCDQFGGWSDTGYCNPEYDELYAQQGVAVDQEERKQIVWEMQEIHQRDRPYIHLVEVDYITVWRTGWDGFHPDLIAYSKLPWTDPHRTEEG